MLSLRGVRLESFYCNEFMLINSPVQSVVELKRGCGFYVVF